MAAAENSKVGAVVTNPLVVTLLVTALSLVVMMAMLRPTASGKAIFRCFIYTCFGVGLLVYIHHSMLQHSLKAQLAKTGSGRLVSEIQNFTGGMQPLASSFKSSVPQVPAPAPAPAFADMTMEPMEMRELWGLKAPH